MFKFAVLVALIGISAAYKKDYDHSIELPVKSKHDLDIIHSSSHVEDHTTHVDIPGGVLPVYLLFKTQSSPVYVKQEHRGTKGSYQKSDSKDEPHKLVHEVVKPVIQELREVITPYRKVVQFIEPVREERLTKVHKGDRDDKDGGYGGNGGYGGYGDDDKKSYNDYKKSDDKKYGNDDNDDKKYGKSDDKEYGNDDNDDKKYGKSDDNEYKGYSMGY